MDLPDGTTVPAQLESVGRLGEVPAAASRSQRRSTAPVLALAGAPLLITGLFLRPHMQQAWPARQYLAVHIVVEALVCTAAFATFAVQWYAAGARLNDARARFIGSGFLAVGLLEMVHMLAFPGMPGLLWIESSTERGIVYWLAARLCAVSTLIGALGVEPDGRARALRRMPLLACALGFVGAVLAADHLWISRQPVFFVEGQGLSALKKAIEAAAAGVALAGVVLYHRDHLREGEESSRDLSLALALTVLSELCFMSYARAYDSFNLLGHVYLLLASYGVFHALFANAVIRPYERLGATMRDLGESNAELRRLRTHIEGELEVTIRNLKAMQEERENYLRAASHDLRMPLQVVLLQGESLARAAEAGTREQRRARAIVGAARQMGSMIQDLVDAVHLESGAVRLSVQRVELGTFIPEVLAIVRGALETDRVALEIHRELPAVAADPQRLARVTQNLVDNALKYSPPGSGVMVRARSSGDEVVLSVEDRGAGIGPEHMPRLFERFYRGANAGKPGGLGLGLYISRMTIEAHGGRMWCESKPGEGSRFSFTLPVERDALPAEGDPAP
jgi:two-component system sensor histidine kinase BarA